MKTAILTGFEAFGDYAVNPTEILARSLEGNVLAEHIIHPIIFPTTVLSPHTLIDHGREVVEDALSKNAPVIISLGLASRVKGVRIETKCVNWVENDTYCTKFESRKPVSGSLAPKKELPMPIQMWNLAELFEKLSAVNIPFEMSEDAGSYCCNALMLRTLQAMKDFSVQIPFMFIHVPCTEEAIANIPNFDRTKKILFHQKDLATVVEKLLESYCHQQR